MHAWQTNVKFQKTGIQTNTGIKCAGGWGGAAFDNNLKYGMLVRECSSSCPGPNPGGRELESDSGV